MGVSLRCSRHMGVGLHAHPVRDELHIQRHANRELATKGTRITQKMRVCQDRLW